MSEPVYSRAPDVVWRLAPDRVLVRRTVDRGDDAAADLTGEAAVAWIALDEPATVDELERRLSDVAAGQVGNRAMASLVERGWLEVQTRTGGAR